MQEGIPELRGKILSPKTVTPAGESSDYFFILFLTSLKYDNILIILWGNTLSEANPSDGMRLFWEETLSAFSERREACKR
ncbi:MAG: hypothetical protein B6245_08300 [Desulfobacteraceae bacterium 4572_88]|nr:MAG: hypothetical protein B6245_08300 [Desulfobacteraceae bacterium 4572_88]